MSIEQAAAAFDIDLGNGAEVSKPGTSQIAVEDLFPSRTIENDVVAGGDSDMEAPAPRVQRAPLVRVQRDEARAAVEGEGDEEDALYGTSDAEDPEIAETEEQGQNDDEDEGEVLDELPEDIAGLKVKVIADGQEVEVTLAEAVLGYQRTEVFHRRLNKLVAVAKELETEAGVVVAKRTEALGLIDQLGTQLAEFLPAEPDWDEQFKIDPIKARVLQKNYNTLRDKLTTLATKRQELLDKNAEDQAKLLSNFIVTEKQKVFDRNAHWSDPKKMKIDLASMTRTLRTEGFNDDEIKQLYDSRMIAIALKASKYDRMTAKRPVPSKRGKAPIANSGAGRVRTAPKNLQRDQSQLAKTGRVEDAAAVFQQLLQ